MSELPSGEMLLVIEVPPSEWIPIDGELMPHIAGFGRINLRGAPDLPARRERIALHRGSALQILSVEVDWVEENLPGRLASFPALDPDRELFDPEAEFPGAGYWPANPVEIAIPDGAFRTLRFATLAIHPMQVDVAAARYRVARRIEVRLSQGAARGQAPSRGVSQAMDPLVEKFAPSLALGGENVARSPMLSLKLDSSPLAPSTNAAAMGNFPAWHFDVISKGLHRITYEWAQSNAPDLFTFLTSNDPRQYRMTTQGIEIPIQVEGESDGTFDPGDAIIFFGEPVGAVDLLDPDIWQSGDFTDINVYRLDISGAPQRITDATGTRAPRDIYPVPSSFRASVHHEENDKFQGFIPADGIDHWYVDPFVVSPQCIDLSVDVCEYPVDPSFCSSCDGASQECCAASEDQFVSTPGHAGGSIDVRVKLLGFSEVNHQSDILVDGVLVDRADWDGEREFVQGVEQGPITYTPATPLAATTRVSTRLPLERDLGGTPLDRDVVAINWVEIDYDRVFEAAADRLAFEVSSDGSQQVELAAFSTMPVVWEVSDSTLSDLGMSIALPSRVANIATVQGGYGFEVDKQAQSRRFSAATRTAMFVPSRVREDKPPSTLEPGLGNSLKTAFGADWVIIGERSLLTDPLDGTGDTLGPRLQDLVAHREGQGCGVIGPGCQAVVIDIQDVYDDFSEGVEDPQAIRDFVSYVLSDGNWNPAPSYLLFVGDATWDYKNDYGHPVRRLFVPTYMNNEEGSNQFRHYPSDTHFAAVIGSDDLPDIIVGRIPAHDFAEAEVVFQKIVDYETGPVNAVWAGKALLVSEHKESPTDTLGSDFFRVHDEVYDEWFAGPPALQQATKLYEPSPYDSGLGCQGAADDLNQRIDDSINGLAGTGEGAAMLSFVGHGSFAHWGKSCAIFEDKMPGVPDDLDDILENTHPMFTVHANCITGNFSADNSAGRDPEFDQSYSFVEDWILAPSKGYIAGLAPSFLTYTFELDSIIDTVYEGLYGKEKLRVAGDLDTRLRLFFDSKNDRINIRSFILTGDPATRLMIPAPEAPDLISVDRAGSGELVSTWSSTPAGQYRLYRSTIPRGPYTMIYEGSDTTFTDTGLENCRDYYYYTVSVDADGFESAWSNFNETCRDEPPGADCRTQSPENPNPPPAPTVTAVVDLEQGGKLRVDWQKPSGPEANQILYYRVSWDTEPGGGTNGYDFERVVGARNSSTVLGGLTDGTTYYVAVRSEHCSQIGAFSNEMSGIPRLVRGQNPPAVIGDLMVYRIADTSSDSSAELRLTWSAPGESVWGTDTSVARYEIYGSQSAPSFPLDASTLLTDQLGPLDTEWIHLNQGAPDGLPWFYVIVAVDQEELRSAAGSGLPNGIDDLTLREINGETEIEFRWSQVRDSLEGPPVIIEYYDLYGRASVLPRTAVAPGNLVQGGIPDSTQPSTTQPVPSGTLFTYQLIAVGPHGDESVW